MSGKCFATINVALNVIDNVNKCLSVHIFRVIMQKHDFPPGQWFDIITVLKPMSSPTHCGRRHIWLRSWTVWKRELKLNADLFPLIPDCQWSEMVHLARWTVSHDQLLLLKSLVRDFIRARWVSKQESLWFATYSLSSSSQAKRWFLPSVASLKEETRAYPSSQWHS